jgi:hypothetical protein
MDGSEPPRIPDEGGVEARMTSAKRLPGGAKREAPKPTSRQRSTRKQKQDAGEESAMAGEKSAGERQPRHPDPGADGAQLRIALNGLAMLGGDMFMRMQAFNLSITDPFLADLEAEVLRKLIDEEHTPVSEASFLSALSQMWIFAAYELLRTWRQRAGDLIKWSETGGLETKLAALEKEVGYTHHARQMRAEQIRRVIADPSLIDRMKVDLRATHILFGQLEALRVAIAKHEVAGRRNSVALRPGYGRINQWTGSLDYELENGKYSMGYVSRRDIADGIRGLLDGGALPDDKTLKEFDDYMRGLDVEVPEFDP